MSFQIPDRVSLACLPTPIHRLERLGKEVNGVDLYIKRDDLTGAALTGNKVRKLEFIFADVLQKQCDSVITTGGMGSNHARATTIAARKFGLTPYLVLRGKPKRVPDGNLFLNTLCNAEIKFISSTDYKKRDEIMMDFADNLRKQGKKPYIIPEGASNALGVWGYFFAVKEIKDQISKNLSGGFDAIVTATGSGGTQSGLLLGLQHSGMNIPVYGVNVCDDANYIKHRILNVLSDFKKAYEYPHEIYPEKIRMIGGYVGKGYGLSRQPELDMIKKLAALEGIFLDPVYTGKAMVGLMDQIKKGRFKQGEKILFIHTGGIFGLFPKRYTFYGGPDVGEFPLKDS